MTYDFDWIPPSPEENGRISWGHPAVHQNVLTKKTIIRWSALIDGDVPDGNQIPVVAEWDSGSAEWDYGIFSVYICDGDEMHAAECESRSFLDAQAAFGAALILNLGPFMNLKRILQMAREGKL